MDVRTVNLGELAELVSGQLINGKNQGESLAITDLPIYNALPLQDACDGCLTFADSPKQLERVERSSASAVLVSEPLEGCSKPMLLVSNAHAAFQTIVQLFRPVRTLAFEGVSTQASVCGSATIGPGTAIGHGATVGADCEIGARCRLHPNVHIMAGCKIGDDCEFFPGTVLYPDTVVGSRVLVHANSVLGAYGFGYRTIAGRQQRSAQLGWVELGDDVEIGAGVTIDRGTYGATKIGEGSKLDNQVHIGHNCQIGRHNLLCAHVGMAGSCSTGDYVVMAGQAGMADHIHLGDRVVIGGQAGVMQDVPDGQTMFGSPAMPSKRKMQEVAIAARLPEMRRELRDLQKQMQELRAETISSPSVESRDAA